MSLKRVIAGIIALYNKLHQQLKFLQERLDVALSTRASEATLSSINSKIPNPTPAGNFPVALKEDGIGLAKESTINDLKTTVDTYLPNLDLPITTLRDSIISKLAETLPREAHLHIYSTSQGSWVPVQDIFPVSINQDNVGLAKEETLSSINSKLPSLTPSGNFPVAVQEDNIGIAKEDTIQRVLGLEYDFAFHKNGGRLLSIIDFTLKNVAKVIDEFTLGLIKVEGDYDSYSIVQYSAEGIPMPEGTGSPNVLKIVIKAGGTVYVRIPIKASFFKPFCAYITLYSKDYDVYVLPYVVLGGILSGSRNKLPKRLKLPANNWGRFIVHWFMEAHHGCSEIIIEIYNPQTVSVPVYVGVVTACEIYPHIKGFCLLFGWEGTFELELNNESLSFSVDIMLPTDIKNVAHLSIGYSITGDGTNPLNLTIKVHPAGITLVSDSQTATSYKNIDKFFKAFLARRGIYTHPTLTIEVNLSTVGSGKLGKFIVVLFGFTDEYEYSKDVSKDVSGGTTDFLIDLSGDIKHIKGACLKITAPTDGDVNILADTPEGEIVIKKIPAGQTETITICGRYTYLKVQNTGSGTANICGNVVISDSLLLR